MTVISVFIYGTVKRGLVLFNIILKLRDSMTMFSANLLQKTVLLFAQSVKLYFS